MQTEADRQTVRHADRGRQTDLQTDRQADRGRQRDRHTDRQTDRVTDRQTESWQELVSDAGMSFCAIRSGRGN